jgi:hypothetical protein
VGCTPAVLCTRAKASGRAARALDDDFPAVLAALRRGLEDKDAGKAARTAVAYVQLVYGRQLQQPADEAQSVDPLDVSAMSREERDALSRAAWICRWQWFGRAQLRASRSTLA